MEERNPQRKKCYKELSTITDVTAATKLKLVLWRSSVPALRTLARRIVSLKPVWATQRI
jgi:hypothetical protein